MIQIHFATTNKGKLETLKRAMHAHGIEIIHAPIELPEPQSYDLREIARQKVKFAYMRLQKPCIALDAGFFIHAWNGFPGAYVKFALEMLGLKGILKLVQNESQACEFRHCIAYIDDKMSEPLVFEVVLPGTLCNPRGKFQSHHWSELTTIFIPQGYDKTLAEMNPDDYTVWKTKLDTATKTLADHILSNKKIVI